jgi:hypothetical protein
VIAGLIERWLHANRSHSLARLDSAPAPNANAPVDLQVLAQRELSIPGRYRIARPPQPAQSEPWWMRLWSWTYDRWNHFWHAVFGRVHVGRAEVAGIGDVLLVLVGLLLIFVTVTLLAKLQLLRSGARAASEPLTAPPSPRALYRQASDAASCGDYGRAVLLLFAAMAALLHRRGDLENTSSATVGDLRRALRAKHAALVAGFDIVAAPFVQRAYADRAVDEQQWQGARAAYDALARRPGPVE